MNIPKLKNAKDFVIPAGGAGILIALSLISAKPNLANAQGVSILEEGSYSNFTVERTDEFACFRTTLETKISQEELGDNMKACQKERLEKLRTETRSSIQQPRRSIIDILFRNRSGSGVPLDQGVDKDNWK